MAKKTAKKTVKKSARPSAKPAPKRASAGRSEPAEVDPITAALQRRRLSMLSR